MVDFITLKAGDVIRSNHPSSDDIPYTITNVIGIICGEGVVDLEWKSKSDGRIEHFSRYSLTLDIWANTFSLVEIDWEKRMEGRKQ